MDLKNHDRVFPEKFAPATRADLADFEERLLTAIAHALSEQPSRTAIAARSTELIALMDDVVADWAAVVLAGERGEAGETKTQLRTVAQFSSDTLSDLVQGMTWTETAGSLTAVVKLAQQGTAWTYSFTYADPRSGASETIAGGTSFSSKREAGLRAAAAVWEAAAKYHGGIAAGADVI